MDGLLKLPRDVRRDLILLLALKLGMLTVIYILFFSPSHRPIVDAVAQIAGTAPGHQGRTMPGH